MDEKRTRRCVFCGREKGDLVNPADPGSREVIIDREHIFRRSWKKKLKVSSLPGNPERKLTKYGVDGSIKISRPDPLFELVIKGACNHCNSGWMNGLDSAVQPWIFNPYSIDIQPDPKIFRRWAIKIAVLRGYYENPLLPQPGDFRTLYDGGDMEDWHVFIGRTKALNHTHVFAGFGPISNETGGRLKGITQISWSLGHVCFIAIRLIRDCTWATDFFKFFKSSNRSSGILMVEILPTARSFPNLAALPEMSLVQFGNLAWYFSTRPTSPISEGVRGIEDGIRQVMDEMGREYRNL